MAKIESYVQPRRLYRYRSLANLDHELNAITNRTLTLCGVQRKTFWISALVSLNIGILLCCRFGFGLQSLASALGFFAIWIGLSVYFSWNDPLYLPVVFKAARQARYYDPVPFREDGLTVKETK